MVNNQLQSIHYRENVISIDVNQQSILKRKIKYQPRETFEDIDLIMAETMDRQSNKGPKHETHSPQQNLLFTPYQT